MEYVFQGEFHANDGNSHVHIPFNVWEVCEDQIGEIPVHVDLNGKKFDCKLESVKNGYYKIPLTKEQAVDLVDYTVYPITFSIAGYESVKRESSPYSIDNPIRKIDGITSLQQPFDGLCGQTAFAMIAGVSIDDAIQIMHCREWQANMAKIVPSLDYVGIKHADQIIYTSGTEVTLPKCCIVMQHLGRYSHYMIHFDGKYYCPNEGIMKSLDPSTIKGYLEIMCD